MQFYRLDKIWLLDCFHMESLGNSVHKQECLKGRDGGGFKIWNFVSGRLLGLFVCFGLL